MSSYGDVESLSRDSPASWERPKTAPAGKTPGIALEDRVETLLLPSGLVGANGAWRPPLEYGLALPDQDDGPVVGAAFAPGRELFAIVRSDGIVKVWLPGGALESTGAHFSKLPWGVAQVLEHRTELKRMMCELTGACAIADSSAAAGRAPGASRMAVGSTDGTCFIWQEEADARRQLGEPLWELRGRLQNHKSAVVGCCFSHRQQLLATLDMDGVIVLSSSSPADDWMVLQKMQHGKFSLPGCVTTPRDFVPLPGPGDHPVDVVPPSKPMVRSIAFAPQRPLLAIVLERGSCLLWAQGASRASPDAVFQRSEDDDPWAGAMKELRKLGKKHPELRADAAKAVENGWSVLQELWVDGTGPECETTDIAFAPQRVLLATATLHGTCALWVPVTRGALDSFEQIEVVETPGKAMMRCCFSSGDRLFLSTCQEAGVLDFWAPKDPQNQYGQWTHTQRSTCEHSGGVKTMGVMALGGADGLRQEGVMCTAGLSSVTLWRERDRFAQPSSTIRPARCWEMLLPLASLLVTSWHKMALAFAPGLPWARLAVWPISSPLRLTVLELELWGEPALLAWYRWAFAGMFGAIFIGCALYGRSPGYHVIMTVGSRFVVVPMVRNLASPWTWDPQEMGIGDQSQLVLAEISMVLLFAYMLLCVPPHLQVPSHFWLNPRSWRQTAEDRLRGTHLGKLRPNDESLLNSLFSLAVLISLAQTSLLHDRFRALQGGLSLLVVAAHLLVHGISPPFEDPALNAFAGMMHVATFWIFFCALVSVGVPGLGAFLLYAGLICITACGVLVVKRLSARSAPQVPPSDDGRAVRLMDEQGTRGDVEDSDATSVE